MFIAVSFLFQFHNFTVTSGIHNSVSFVVYCSKIQEMNISSIVSMFDCIIVFRLGVDIRKIASFLNELCCFLNESLINNTDAGILVFL